MGNIKRAAVLVGSLSLAALTLGCATGSTPYQPISASNQVAGGYSETRLAADSYRVTFAGNRFTSREDVEGYLLYRSAELTVQQNFDWFVIQDREVERRVDREVRRDPYYDPWFGNDYGYWRPYWRYYQPRSGWQSWYPYYGDPFWSRDIDVRTVERFEVTAEIKMGHGAMPATNLRAFDARDVLARLGPNIRQPD